MLADPSQFTADDKSAINAGIDKELARFKSYGLSDEESTFKAVDLWVNRTVYYESDLRNYGMLEYLATAKEVLDRKIDDCDGTAVLSAAIMHMRGLPKAQVATNVAHAEVKLNTTILPAPTPLPAATPLRVRLEINFDSLMAFPWGRLACGILFFYVMCEVGIRCVHRSNGMLPFVCSMCIVCGAVLLELFTGEYLKQPVMQAISFRSWVVFYLGLGLFCAAFAIWLLARIYSFSRCLLRFAKTSPVSS